MQKNYYIYAITTCLIVVAAACMANYYIDPAHIFDQERKYEQKIVNKLISGKNVTNISNYDERILQKLYVKSITKPPGVIVLGSSRSMMIREHLFKDQSFYNSSVSGASLEDHMAIYQMYYDKKLIPDSVILGLDPWVLNKNNGQHRWASISDSFNDITQRLGISQAMHKSNSGLIYGSKYLQLISFSYLQESLNLILKKIKRVNTEVTETDEIYSKSNTKLADGSLVYGEKTRNRTIEDVRTRAIGNSKRGSIYALNDFTELDYNLKNILEKFIKTIIEDKTNPIIFLPPYHPLTYREIESNSKYIPVLETEIYLRKTAAENHIQIIGSYNPKLVGCDESQFTDDMHPKEECINTIFSHANKNLTR